MTRELATHLYVPDQAAPADHRGDRPCTCGLPPGNRAHELPDAGPEQAEHRRRAGEAD